MRIVTTLLLLAVVIFTLVFTGTQIIENYAYKTIQEVEFDFNVIEGSEIGFNANTDKVHFGGLCKGCSGYRDIFIQENESRVKIRFLIASNDSRISQWMYIKPNDEWVIEKGEEVRFRVHANPTAQTPVGFYEGSIIIQQRKALKSEKNPIDLGHCFSQDYRNAAIKCKNEVYRKQIRKYLEERNISIHNI